MRVRSASSQIFAWPHLAIGRIKILSAERKPTTMVLEIISRNNPTTQRYIVVVKPIRHRRRWNKGYKRVQSVNRRVKLNLNNYEFQFIPVKIFKFSICSDPLSTRPPQAYVHNANSNWQPLYYALQWQRNPLSGTHCPTFQSGQVVVINDGKQQSESY